MNPHQRLVQHLAAGALDSEDAAHASRCPACAALLPAGAAEADAPVDAGLLAALQREASRPVRAWWRWPALLALANLALAAAAVHVLEPWNAEASTSPVWLFLGASVVLLGLTTAGALLALAPRRRWPEAALALAGLSAAGVLLAADGRAANARFWDGATCLVTVVLLALLPLSAGLLLLVRVAYSPLRALAVGLLSAGVGLLVLQFHCTDGARPHLLVFHLLPWAVLGVAAVLLRRLLSTWSYAP